MKILQASLVTLLLGLLNRQQSKVIEGEKRYRALFEHASDGIGVTSAADHLLVDANKRFGDILGYNHQAIAGTHVCDLMAPIGDGGEHALLSRLCLHGAAEPGEAVVGNWSDEVELDLRTSDVRSHGRGRGIHIGLPVPDDAGAEEDGVGASPEAPARLSAAAPGLARARFPRVPRASVSEGNR